jgi:hypothetical protein
MRTSVTSAGSAFSRPGPLNVGGSVKNLRYGFSDPW